MKSYLLTLALSSLGLAPVLSAQEEHHHASTSGENCCGYDLVEASGRHHAGMPLDGKKLHEMALQGAAGVSEPPHDHANCSGHGHAHGDAGHADGSVLVTADARSRQMLRMRIETVPQADSPFSACCRWFGPGISPEASCWLRWPLCSSAVWCLPPSSIWWSCPSSASSMPAGCRAGKNMICCLFLIPHYRGASAPRFFGGCISHFECDVQTFLLKMLKKCTFCE